MEEFHLVRYLENNAIFAPERIKYCDVQKILKGLKLQFIGKGTFSRVFRIVGTDWVVKEGRWDFDLELLPELSIPVPVEETEEFLSLFSLTFLPRASEITRQYAMYLQFCKFFGYFDDDCEYFHPKKKWLFSAQKKIRNKLGKYIKMINKKFYYFFPLDERKLNTIFSLDEVCKHNYLPNEFMLAGDAISIENSNKSTYYIFQEYIEGKHFHDVNIDKIDDLYKYQMILMLFLILVLYQKFKIVPDLRPRNPLFEIMDAISNTDNVILGSGGIKFIDTRWFYTADGNIVKRQFILPDIILYQVKTYLKKLLSSVSV